MQHNTTFFYCRDLTALRGLLDLFYKKDARFVNILATTITKDSSENGNVFFSHLVTVSFDTSLLVYE